MTTFDTSRQFSRSGKILAPFSEKVSKKGSTPYPLGAGSARPNPKMGAPDPENPLFPGLSVLRWGLRPWSQTMVSIGARPWGRGRSRDCEKDAGATGVGATGLRGSERFWGLGGGLREGL